MSVIIPAFNEEDTIAEVVSAVKHLARWSYEILVIDDGSSDHTVHKAKGAGAVVISHTRNKGYLEALRTGFKQAKGQIMLTMDADGQHDPRDIPKLVEPILTDRLDVVIGDRHRLGFSEQVITQLTRLRVRVTDACSGFRAIKADVAKAMRLKGTCGCGTLILEAWKVGARIGSVPVNVTPRQHGERKMNAKHFRQCLILIKELLADI